MWNYALTSLLLVSVGMAQVSVTVATSGNGLAASWNSSCNSSGVAAIPAGVDVSAGTTLSQVGDPAHLTVDVALASEQHCVTLSGGAWANSCPWFHNANTEGEIEVLLTAPVPTVVDATLMVMNGNQGSCGGRSGSVTIVGGPALHSDACPTNPNPFEPNTGCAQSAQLTVDATGVVVRLWVEFWGYQSSSSACFSGGGGGGGVSVEVKPVPSAVAYGTECGATIFAGESLLQPGLGVIHIEGPFAHTFSVLLLGLGQGATPTPFGCDLLITPVVADAGLTLDVDAVATLLFPLPAPSGLTVQAVTTDFADLAFSGGLQF